MADRLTHQQRIELLEGQLSVFAHEYGDRAVVEKDLRGDIHTSLISETMLLTELHDVYSMHKAHLQETVALLDSLQAAIRQLARHVQRMDIVMATQNGSDWYKRLVQLGRQLTTALLKRKGELSPYLAEDWRPPDENSWAGRLAQVAAERSGAEKSRNAEKSRKSGKH